MLPEWYRIQHRRDEIPNTFTLTLEPCEHAPVPSFACGQFNMLYVFGVGEIPISISGDPEHPCPLIHTIRAVGNVSARLKHLKVADQIGVRGPFGRPWPIELAHGKDLLLVAGGLGLAPLRSVLYHVIAHRKAFGRVTLLYGARTPEDILYRKECEQWRSRSDLDVAISVDRGDDDWRGSVGVVPRLIARSLFDPTNTVALICGPEVMMRFSAVEVEHCGVPGEQIFISMERNMKCALGFCGHCQCGPFFTCKDGPVLPYLQVRDLLCKREI
ncbi:FAD/NAD(P)-binding protein [Dictyobacter alpinus]|nr:FAD/NAD(P)-binding protein [Dictyobacter alpinus]